MENYQGTPSCCVRQNYIEDRKIMDPNYPDKADYPIKWYYAKFQYDNEIDVFDFLTADGGNPVRGCTV